MPVAVKVIDLKDIDSPLLKHLLNCEVDALSKIKNAQKSLLLATINKIKQLHPEE